LANWWGGRAEVGIRWISMKKPSKPLASKREKETHTASAGRSPHTPAPPSNNAPSSRKTPGTRAFYSPMAELDGHMESLLNSKETYAKKRKVKLEKGKISKLK